MEELKLKFTQASPTGGDETAMYDIKPNRQCTLGELVEHAMQRISEWGEIIVPGHGRIEYRWGKLFTDNFPDDLLNRDIETIIGVGGWSRMDYRIKLKDNATEQPQDIIEHLGRTAYQFIGHNLKENGNVDKDQLLDVIAVIIRRFFEDIKRSLGEDRARDIFDEFVGIIYDLDGTQENSEPAH